MMAVNPLDLDRQMDHVRRQRAQARDAFERDAFERDAASVANSMSTPTPTSMWSTRRRSGGVRPWGAAARLGRRAGQRRQGPARGSGRSPDPDAGAQAAER